MLAQRYPSDTALSWKALSLTQCSSSDTALSCTALNLTQCCSSDTALSWTALRLMHCCSRDTAFFLDSAQFNSMLSKTELSVEIKSADYLIIFVPNYQFLKINT